MPYNCIHPYLSKLIGTVLLAVVGCSQATDQIHLSTPSAKVSSVLRLASTTSTRDSGLFERLLPEFEESHDCRVDLVAVGTGAALRLGEAGDVDVIVCHARSAEEAFMQAGHGIRHVPVMHNSFLIVGPVDDPARIKGTDVIEAFKKIAAGKHKFTSRGDDSGTHQRERAYWKQIDESPEWKDYVEVGQGMGPTLIVADEMNAYVLTDEATWLRHSANSQLVSLVSKSVDLYNRYAVMVVNPQKHSAINGDLANQFAEFLISSKGQRLIAEFKINGQPVFFPEHIEDLAE